MIIVCPECSTKFNIDDEKLPEGPAKVRCARCKHVFLVEKEAVKSDASEFNYEKFQELDNPEDEESFSFGDSIDEQDEMLQATARKTPQTRSAKHAFEAPATSSVTPQKKGSVFTALIKILLLVILLLLIATGVYIYQNGTEGLNQKVQELLGQQVEQTPSTGEITLNNLEGKFISNTHAGELFLIRGVAVNNFTAPRSGIQVKGVIYDQNGKPLLQKTVFCGNPITDAELQTLDFSKLEELMGNQFGKDLSNMKVDVKQEITFDIVFRDLPSNLSEFSAKVTTSKAADE
jgi:predicted Zn finger-like uncharacterized protein